MANQKTYIFEYDYGDNCAYQWPFSRENYINIYRLMSFAYLYDDFESFLKVDNIFVDDKWDSSSDEDFDIDYQNKEREREARKVKGAFLAAKVEKWPYPQIVCSCIFETLSKEIQTKGCISDFTWKVIVPHLTSSIIGPELLVVIKRNGFFELDSAKAIKGTSDFFRRNLDIRFVLENIPTPDGELGALRVLEAIQVDIKKARELVNEAVKQQDTSVIVTFLETYVVPKAK